MSKDRARLLDILDWARVAIKEAVGRTRADFDTDENFFLAQVKRVEVVGEAASRLTPGTCELIAEVPWAAVSATRNRLVHGYHAMRWKSWVYRSALRQLSVQPALEYRRISVSQHSAIAIDYPQARCAMPMPASCSARAAALTSIGATSAQASNGQLDDGPPIWVGCHGGSLNLLRL